jgi:type II restriction enzyme
MQYNLNKQEQILISEIENSFYMPPTIERINIFIKDKKIMQLAWKECFNQIYEILCDSKNDVEKILERRKIKGEISDIRQAMKSIAGNTFSNAIIYIFLKNKLIGNIKSKIFITNKKSQIKNFENIATIYVDGETQKPDVDLIIFTKKDNDDVVENCIILSLKTSLRERAGQTYKWKLLLEIASCNNPIKEKYGISYNPVYIPLICFATVNFYNEISNPQHKGMFKFFDKSFIAKPINKDFISSLSNLVDFVNEKL